MEDRKNNFTSLTKFIALKDYFINLGIYVHLLLECKKSVHVKFIHTTSEYCLGFETWFLLDP